VPVRWSPVVGLDILCSDRAVINTVVDKLVLGVCAVAGHLDMKVDPVIELAIFTSAGRETPGRDTAKIGVE